jgi:hypothetical protein
VNEKIRRGQLGLAITIFFLISVIPVTAINPHDVNVSLVNNVFEFGIYSKRWVDTYNPGEKIQLYVDVKNINNYRAVAVDFVAIVVDPNDYVVWAGSKRITELGYTDRIYYIFNISVDENWIDGEYRIDVYVFNVLDDISTYSMYADLYKQALFGKYNPKIFTKDRESSEYVKKSVTFTVDKNFNTEPPYTLILVEGKLKAVELPEKVSNTLKITILNTQSESKEVTLTLMVDRKEGESKTTTIPPYSTKEVELEIKPLPLGKHSIEVIATGARHQYTYGLMPVLLPPILNYEKLYVGEVINGGEIVYSDNSYILGAINISIKNDIQDMKEIQDLVNKMFSENTYNALAAEKTLTNIFAYLWKKHNGRGELDVAIYKGSDQRAELILPAIISKIEEDSKAPITFWGTVGPEIPENIDILVLVGKHVKITPQLANFLENGGHIIVDDTTGSLIDSGIRETIDQELKRILDGWKGWKPAKPGHPIYNAFYDTRVNRSVEIKLKSELKYPPEFKISDLEVQAFIAEVNKSVPISFKVFNNGGYGAEDIILTVNGEEIYKEKVALDTGEEKIITLTYTPTKEGAYKVEIKNGPSKVFFAKEKEKPPVSKETPVPTPVKEKREGAGLVVVVAGIFAVLVILRIFLRE